MQEDTSSKSDSKMYTLLNVPISATTIMESTQKIIDWCDDDIGRFVCVRDVPSLMVIRKNQSLLEGHKKASLVTPDGMPLVWVGKLCGYTVERTYGPDLMLSVLEKTERQSIKHFFFGGHPKALINLVETLKDRYPMLHVVGHHSPPFRPQTPTELEATIDSINKSGADILWVGISSPKQEAWMIENYTKLKCTCIGVGAAFDFHSGRIKQAPRWMQQSGLEWAFRIFQEPRRLFFRYAKTLPLFMILTAINLPRMRAFAKKNRCD